MSARLCIICLCAVERAPHTHMLCFHQHRPSSLLIEKQRCATRGYLLSQHTHRFRRGICLKLKLFMETCDDSCSSDNKNGAYNIFHVLKWSYNTCVNITQNRVGVLVYCNQPPEGEVTGMCCTLKLEAGTRTHTFQGYCKYMEAK